MPYSLPVTCLTLSGIAGSDCIGDTRSIINDNAYALGTVLCNLSSNTVTLSTTSTVQHTFTNSTRLLASDVRNLSINTRHLANDSVTTAKISAEAVTTDKIALSAITTDKIALSAVTADRINLTTSLSTNGYQIMPGGLIMQWGKIDSINFNETNQGPYLFPVSFPNNCLNIVTTIIRDTGITGVWNANVNTVTLSSFKVYGDYDVGTGTSPIYWQAIGY